MLRGAATETPRTSGMELVELVRSKRSKAWVRRRYRSPSQQMISFFPGRTFFLASAEAMLLALAETEKPLQVRDGRAASRNERRGSLDLGQYQQCATRVRAGRPAILRWKAMLEESLWY